MGGANSTSGVGFFYRQDPSGQGRTGPMIYEIFGRYQVLVPEDNWLRIVAECVHPRDAAAVLDRYFNDPDGSEKEA